MDDSVEHLGSALADRYRVERELGRGGMGVVLLAHDIKHDRRVAIKILRSEVAAAATATRFLREIRIIAQLQHPNILSLIDSGVADSQPYFVTPYIGGESLRHRLAREQQLPIDDAVQIAREVADALAYAHGQGVIHRDIKPENILLDAGHAVVADFGVARALAGEEGPTLTQTGMALGTPAYMSPEQATASNALDARTDIYSLGCVLFEMLAGSPPYTGSSPIAVIARKTVDPVPSIRVVRNTVPVRVERIVMKALAKVPADRFATAREFADALTGKSELLFVPGFSAVGINERRRRWMLAGALGTVALIGGLYTLLGGAPWRHGAGGVVSAQFAQLTSATGVEWFPSLSPDGKWIVYSGQESGNRDIYLQSVTGQIPINLTKNTPEADDQPAFSPDGEHIAFRSERDGGGIFVMGRTGEGVRRVTDRGFRPTWSADGTQIAFVTENVETNPGNSNSIGELWVVNANGGTPRRIATGDAILPSWSPHGQRIAFAHRLGGTFAAGNIWTVPATGGAAEPVTTDRARDWSPVWSPDGRYLYFSSNRSGSMNLWRVPVDEGTGKARGAAEPVTTPATFLAHPTIAGDGEHLAYSSVQVSTNIQSIAFDPVRGTVIGEPSFVTTGSRQWSSPDPSPDGRWVAFYTLAQPEGHVYIARADGTDMRELTADTAIDRLPRWSPDGKWLAFFTTRSGLLHIWKVRPDGSDLQIVRKEPAAYVVWSPDGSHLATGVGSRDGVNARSPGLVPADASAPDQRVDTLPPSSLGRLIANDWSPDGKRLAGQLDAVGSAGKGIAVFSLDTRTYERITAFGEWPVWLPDSRRLLFVANGNAFYVADTRTKEVRQVWAVKRDVLGPPRLTRDGRRAYFSRRVTEADIWLLTMRDGPSSTKR